MIQTTFYTGYVLPAIDSKRFPYSTTAVAKMLTDPRVNGNIKLRRFLREHHVLDGSMPNPEYEKLGYFLVVDRPVAFVYKVPVIKVSDAGVAFIRDLVEQKIGNKS
jgi:hypothetical protein